MTQLAEHSLAKLLKAKTHETHDRLDAAIMAADPFSSIPGYGRFLEMQYLFHRDIAALYANPMLQTLLPGLAGRQRLNLVLADLQDIGLEPPRGHGEPVFAAGEAVDTPTALGWLYVAEGSNMGAALLRKKVAELGMSDFNGARHLAPAPEGPAAHWRAFTAGLDAIELSGPEQARLVAGAEAAFERVWAFAHARFG